MKANITYTTTDGVVRQQEIDMGLKILGFDAPRVKPFILKVTDYRVPQKKDLYIDKNGHVKRCQENNYSKRSRPKVIVNESWL